MAHVATEVAAVQALKFTMMIYAVASVLTWVGITLVDDNIAVRSGKSVDTVASSASAVAAVLAQEFADFTYAVTSNARAREALVDFDVTVDASPADVAGANGTGKAAALDASKLASSVDAVSAMEKSINYTISFEKKSSERGRFKIIFWCQSKNK